MYEEICSRLGQNWVICGRGVRKDWTEYGSAGTFISSQRNKCDSLEIMQCGRSSWGRVWSRVGAGKSCLGSESRQCWNPTSAGPVPQGVCAVSSGSWEIIIPPLSWESISEARSQRGWLVCLSPSHHSERHEINVLFQAVQFSSWSKTLKSILCSTGWRKLLLAKRSCGS